MKRTGIALVLAAAAIAGARAQTVESPPAITPDGGTALPLAGQAAREYLLGAVELYIVGLYAEGGFDPSRLASADVPKVLRIAVQYKDDLRRRVSLDWRRELVPVLEPAAAAHIRGAFAPLQHGDVVLVEYVPAQGTTVRVNRSVVVPGASHELMLSFLDHWLGQRPVSEEVKRALLGGP